MSHAQRCWLWLGIVVIGLALLAAEVLIVRPWQASPPQTPTPSPTLSQEAIYAQRREQMISQQLAARDITDEHVLAAMRAVPRDHYVPAQYLPQAYEDHPLPIGYGQTISQPYIVALMTQLLDVGPDDRVLEIGTGSGYQAAVLAQLTPYVVSVEIIPELCDQAKARLGDTVKVICGDGYFGYEGGKPYDGIIVTCAPDHIPQPLVNQLADGGRLVIPVGPPGMYQMLWLLERHGNTVTTKQIGEVAFVPLVRPTPTPD